MLNGTIRRVSRNVIDVIEESFGLDFADGYAPQAIASQAEKNPFRSYQSAIWPYAALSFTPFRSKHEIYLTAMKFAA